MEETQDLKTTAASPVVYLTLTVFKSSLLVLVRVCVLGRRKRENERATDSKSGHHAVLMCN